MVIDFLCNIEALCKAMFIGLFTSRPSAMQWSLISYITLRPSTRKWSSISLHQGPLRGNGHWFPFLYIEALYEAMVINLFTSRPFARQWSLIPLSHWGPLRGNGHRSLYIKILCEAMVINFLCHIEALCEIMVIDLFTSRSSTRQWSLISYVTSSPSARQWSSISLHQGPLRSNGHWFLSSWYILSPWDWSQLFLKKSQKRK